MRYWLLLILLALAWPVQAATRYASPTGTGSAPCTNINAPCAMYTAIPLTVAGDTLYFRGGTYHDRFHPGNVHINAGTSWSNVVTFASYPGEIAVFDWGDDDGAILAIADNLDNSVPAYIVIDRFTIDCSPRFGQPHQGLGFTGNIHDVRFQNGVVKNCGAGQSGQGSGSGGININISGGPTNIQIVNTESYGGYYYGFYARGTAMLLEGNRVHDNGGYGIHYYGEGTHPDNGIVRNNLFYNNGQHDPRGNGSGAMIVGQGQNVQVYNNIFRNNNGGTGRAALQTGYGATVKMYNNTFYDNAWAINLGISTSSAEVINNIMYQSGTAVVNEGIAATISANLCDTSSTGCTIVGNPCFVAPSAGSPDFHIQNGAGCFAVGTGTNLSSTFTTDIEGSTRAPTGPWDVGAYVFTASQPPPDPDPIGLQVALIGTLIDSSGHGRDATPVGGMGANGTPIIAGFNSFLFNGSSQYLTLANSSSLKPAAKLCLSTWINASVSKVGFLWGVPESWGFWHDTDGSLYGYAVTTAGFQVVHSSGVNVLNGLNHHLVLTKDALGYRIYVDNNQVAFLSQLSDITYATGSQGVFIGRNPDVVTDFFQGRMSHVRFYNEQECSPQAVATLFAEYVPVSEVSMATWQFASDDAMQSLQGAIRSPVTHPLSANLGLEVAITNNSGAQIVEYFPLQCARNGGTMTTLTNTLGTLGARIATSPFVNMGDTVVYPTSWPTGGQTVVDGRVVADVIDTSQKTTIPHGGVTAWRYVMGFGSPAVATDVFTCRVVRENGSAMTHYGDDTAGWLPAVTLTAPSLSTGVMAGGVHAGGNK